MCCSSFSSLSNWTAWLTGRGRWVLSHLFNQGNHTVRGLRFFSWYLCQCGCWCVFCVWLWSTAPSGVCSCCAKWDRKCRQNRRDITSDSSAPASSCSVPSSLFVLVFPLVSNESNQKQLVSLSRHFWFTSWRAPGIWMSIPLRWILPVLCRLLVLWIPASLPMTKLSLTIVDLVSVASCAPAWHPPTRASPGLSPCLPLTSPFWLWSVLLWDPGVAIDVGTPLMAPFLPILMIYKWAVSGIFGLRTDLFTFATHVFPCLKEYANISFKRAADPSPHAIGGSLPRASSSTGARGTSNSHNGSSRSQMLLNLRLASTTLPPPSPTEETQHPPHPSDAADNNVNARPSSSAASDVTSSHGILSSVQWRDATSDLVISSNNVSQVISIWFRCWVFDAEWFHAVCFCFSSNPLVLWLTD